MDTPRALSLLDSLSSPVRLDLFRLLVRCSPGGLVAGEIATRLGIAANAASFHLKNLQQAGLVDVVAEGRFQRYRARLDAISALIGFLTAECCQGQPDGCAIEITACAPLRHDEIR